MKTFRGSLSTIPGTLSNLIGSMPTPSSMLALGRRLAIDEAATTTTPTRATASVMETSASSWSCDDLTDRAQAIPGALITEEWQLVLGQNASVDDLNNAIERCKELVIVSDECSAERRWLVRHLVELRFRLNELRDVIDDPRSAGPKAMVILGHHFVVGTATAGRHHCDHCSGIIWSVVQASYACIDCDYRVHHKCVHSIIRICAHVVASERTEPMLDISPEVGLARQQYKCAECEATLNLNKTWMDARQCDYTGLYYCASCHWNDKAPTPARVIHNWDLVPRKVCRASLQVLQLTRDRADLHVADRNAKLFIYVHNLSLVQKLRDNIVHMRRYLDECRLAAAERLVDQHVDGRRHLIQSTHLYSMADLLAAEAGTLIDHLNRVFQAFDGHIRQCTVCSGKGYLCEICGNDEAMFPHDDAAVWCTAAAAAPAADRPRCGALYHRACWVRKNMQCPKCRRLAERRALQDGATSMTTNAES